MREDQKGWVHQINISDGGVPKYPVDAVQVTHAGIIGDKHNDKKHHGGENRALCLYSSERIQSLRMEGHNIYPGALGENISVNGMDWETLTPGVILQIGDEVSIEITAFTQPCLTIAHTFSACDFMRISQERFPGWSRLYARV